MNTMDVNPPFTDQEKRFVLAEAIKTSGVPVEKILVVFYDGSVQPDWPQMLLPHGRNLQSCINTFEALRPSQPPPPPPPFHTQSYQVSLPPPLKTTKRKPPPENLETSGGHDQKRRISDIAPHASILPKPPNGSQGFPSPNTTQGKKRGRPSKAAVAQRDAEAIARGEVIAPPRTSSLRAEPPASGERVGTPVYANIAPMVSPRPMPSPITPAPFDNPSFASSEVGSPKKKRLQPKKTLNPGETSFLVASPPISGERSTYPSIISSLTDTIPVSRSREMSPYRPPQPAPNLLPPISAPPPGLPPLPPRTAP